MKINSISILGLGLIGGSIAKSLKASDVNVKILGYDKSDILDLAKSQNVIDEKLNSIDEAIQSEIIFLCFPLDLSLKVFKEISPKLNSNNLLTDVCGVKNIFHEEWNKINSNGFFVGGHPMTGKEVSGFENSDSLLFENSIYILTNEAKNFFAWNDFVEIIHKLGARINFLSPKVHDIVVASVSHLPQLLAVTLINSASLQNSDIHFYDYAAGGFRDMTRIASSNFDIWESVIKLNKEKILAAFDSFEIELKHVKSFIENGQLEKLADKFESARKKRDEIPKNRKGMISQLFDLFVFVKDQPGEIAKISTALYKNNINIKDMELLKIREGTGGTFRLSFSKLEEAKLAREILLKEGFSTNL
ncbi:MAG: prephenate dehydrogenase/arogenate dehydrogenase family protein [Melioribacteraceae bacterium]|nr:prephenate dehydrogenase/arogenate dehydrogenase family protein [Melioribacteraceae bacterium]